MAQAAKAYTISSDPAQDGDPLQALVTREQPDVGDYHSFVGDLTAKDDDVDSLFDETAGKQPEDEHDLMIPDDANFLLPPEFDFLLDLPNDSDLEAFLASRNDNVSADSTDYPDKNRELPAHFAPQPALPRSPQADSTSLQQSAKPVTLTTAESESAWVEAPTVLNDAPSCDNTPDGQTPSDLTAENTASELSMNLSSLASYSTPTLMELCDAISSGDLGSSSATPTGDHASEDPGIDDARHESAMALGSEDQLRTHPSEAPVKSLPKSHEIIESCELGQYTPPPSASPRETTPGSQTSKDFTVAPAAALIRRGNFSPIRSLFQRDSSEEQDDPPPKKRKTTKKLHVNTLRSQENLRHSLMLDVNAYHYLIERVKTFMFDKQYPERFADAVLVKTSLSLDAQKIHEIKLQSLARLLLGGGLAEKWWGPESERYETRQLRWPENSSDIITTMAKLLIKVCREHRDREQKEQAKPRAVSVSKEAEQVAELAQRQVLQQREREPSNDVECHISFVLAMNPNHAIRRKIIVSANAYPRYMDLVNFLVKLISDHFELTGIGIMGPLGYARVNGQMEWETMIEVIRSSPTLSSIALCAVEAQPKEVRGRRHTQPRPPQTNQNRQHEVIELD